MVFAFIDSLNPGTTTVPICSLVAAHSKSLYYSQHTRSSVPSAAALQFCTEVIWKGCCYPLCPYICRKVRWDGLQLCEVVKPAVQSLQQKLKVGVSWLTLLLILITVYWSGCQKAWHIKSDDNYNSCSQVWLSFKQNSSVEITGA